MGHLGDLMNHLSQARVEASMLSLCGEDEGADEESDQGGEEEACVKVSCVHRGSDGCDLKKFLGGVFRPMRTWTFPSRPSIVNARMR